MLRYDSCPNCFYPLSGATVCASCGFDHSTIRVPNGTLSASTLLNKKYILGRALGKGGFGITYIAKDISTNRICAIKEYMPSEYALRNNGTNNVIPFADDKAKFVFEHGKEKFIEEAKTLLKLRDNPIVVDILGYFTENNTAYLVMEYLDGQDLRKMARATGGKIDLGFAKMILVTVASSLMEIHRMNILHRDLSPENIIVTSNQEVKLIDFGAARNFVSCQNKGMSILLKPGFAPPEQYNAKGIQGPWSDVYALSATFYNIVSGKPLIDALFRYRGEQQPSLFSMGCAVTKKTSDVIEKGMELDYKKRYRDFKAFLDDIDIDYSIEKKTNVDLSQQQNAQNLTQQSSSVISQNSKSNITVIPTISVISSVGIVGKSAVKKNDIVKIGRSRQNSDYVLDNDTNISRVHCTLRFEEHTNTFYLADLSVNGTYFEDGRRLERNKEYPVSPGTKFYLASRQNMLIAAIETR